MERDLLMLKPNQKLLVMLMLVTLEDTEAMGDTDMVAMEDIEAMEAMVDLDTGDSMEKDLLMLNQKPMLMLAILDTEVMLDTEDMDMVDTEAMAAIGDTEDMAIMDKKNEIRISTNLSKWKISRL